MAGGVLIGALLRVARYGRWKLAHRRRVSNNSVDADQAEPGPRPGRISMALSMALLSDDDPANGVPSTSSLIPKVAPTKRGHHPAPHAAQQPGVVVGATRADSLLLALSSAEENAALQARDPPGQALGRATAPAVGDEPEDAASARGARAETGELSLACRGKAVTSLLPCLRRRSWRLSSRRRASRPLCA